MHLQFIVFLGGILRYNERILREINQKQNSAEFRQRASRLDKWKMAARASLEGTQEEVPDRLEPLAFALCSLLSFLIL